MNRPIFHRQLDPAELARIYGDDHREDYADAYDRRRPSAFRELIDDIRHDPHLAFICEGAGFIAGLAVTVGLAFVWSWVAL